MTLGGGYTAASNAVMISFGVMAETYDRSMGFTITCHCVSTETCNQEVVGCRIGDPIGPYTASRSMNRAPPSKSDRDRPGDESQNRNLSR